MYTWFEFGQFFILSAIVFYMTNILLISYFNIRNKAYLVFLAVAVLIIKLTYYAWSMTGIVLYFRDVKDFDTTDLPHMQNGMLAITIFNLLDLFRSTSVLIGCVITHIVCTRRAKAYRLRL